MLIPLKYVKLFQLALTLNTEHSIFDKIFLLNFHTWLCSLNNEMPCNYEWQFQIRATPLFECKIWVAVGALTEIKMNATKQLWKLNLWQHCSLWVRATALFSIVANPAWVSMTNAVSKQLILHGSEKSGSGLRYLITSTESI